MKVTLIVASILALSLLGARPAIADDLSGASALLCSSSWATVCTSDEFCESGAPWGWDIPQFVEVDIKKKLLSTTKASGENRSTPAEVLRTDNGRILIQGEELGRAFSIFISEQTGTMSSVIAGENMTVSVFGACTPIKGGR